MRHTTDSAVQDIVQGALAVWGTLDSSTFLKVDKEGDVVNIHDTAGLLSASVRRDASPLGRVWYVRLGDRHERVFPSVVTALRYLRGHICPQREAGRIWFGASEGR